MSTITQVWQHYLIQLASAGITGWVVLSAILNWAFWFKTPEEWVGFCEKKPGLAKVIRVIRAWGFDPRKGLLWLKAKAAEKAGPIPSPIPQPPETPETKE
jgi:hypothetical protein